MFVSSFVPRSLPHPSTLGPSQSSPCRLFVLLEAQGVRHPVSVLFNLARQDRSENDLDTSVLPALRTN